MKARQGRWEGHRKERKSEAEESRKNIPFCIIQQKIITGLSSFQVEASESVLHSAQCWLDGLQRNKHPRLLSSSILLSSSARSIQGPLADGRS